MLSTEIGSCNSGGSGGSHGGVLVEKEKFRYTVSFHSFVIIKNQMVEKHKITLRARYHQSF